MTLQVLLVDDDGGSRRSIQRFLADSGYEVTAVADAPAAEAALQADAYSVLVTDYKLPGFDGIELVRRAKTLAPALPCIVITAHGDVQSAVAAMRAGAVHFFEKPVAPALLLEVIREAWERHALRLEVESLRRQLDERFGFDQLIGSSERMRHVFERIKLAAPTNSTVLITGDSGTGKELVAQAIHQNSLRRRCPFVAINCAALPESLVESELFGHEKGAFTGATVAKKGYFEAAERGTLFIDEVGDLPLPLQPKLLRALEQRVITHVGSTREIPIDVRIVSATHQPVERLAKEGKFRADLFYRLSVVRIDLPPLAARRDDIPLLVAARLDQLAAPNGRVCEISGEALDALCSYSWPGNVRELRNVVESMVVLNTSGRIELADLPANVLRDDDQAVEATRPEAPRSRPRAVAGADGPTLAEVERQTILAALERCGGNRTHAAQALGIGLRTIQRKLREYGMDAGGDD